MAEDVPITVLPDEVIWLILEKSSLSVVDVVTFSVTCKHLHNIAFASKKLWRIKFFQRWPALKEAYEDTENYKVNDWLEETICSFRVRKEMMVQLRLMSAKYYKKQELSDCEFRDFVPLFRPDLGAHPLAYNFMVDELISIINQPIMKSNLTDRHYAFKVVTYLKQSHLTDEWQKFIALPEKQQLLEKGATIVAQWSQPEKHVTYRNICKALDDIAEQTLTALKEQHPSHSIFNTPPETFALWKANTIDDNQWSKSESAQIIAALNQVLFIKLGFHGNSEMYYSSENSFIDRVLEHKQGIPITLAIVFESICRRLGVKCEPVSYPAHFLLRWKEKYTNLTSPDEVENYYIDVFNGGRFLTKKSCPRIGGMVFKCPIERNNLDLAATPVQVVERIANNLEVAGRQRTHVNGRAARLRSALELLHMVRPHDTSVILHLARFYMLYQMDLARLVCILSYIKMDTELTSRGPANHILQMLQDYERHMEVGNQEVVEVKRRTPEVKYTIGMIMKHQKYEYLCVITGWDLRCEASPEWIVGMGVEGLNGGANQPFYNVFAHDGTSRYAAQEYLVMATIPQWVNHYEIGRYFCQFKGTHYVPNEEKAKEYPEDAEVRDQLLTKYL